MKITINDRMKKTALVVATALFMGGATGLGIASAQGPTGAGGDMGGFAGPGAAGGAAILACSTTNYTDVAAKALGIESAALRQALVSGKSLQDIATGKGVTIQTVEDALQTARKADVDQALKDGLITQDQYNRMTGAVSPSSSDNSTTPEATQQANQDGQDNPGGPGNQMPPRPNGMRGGAVRVPDHNVVNELDVASKALNMSCADLVKAMQGGQSIAQVAVAKNVQVQPVVDALVTAFKAAITQDVQEGLTAQAVADGQISQVINRAGLFVYSARPERGPAGMGGRGSRGMGQGNGGQPGNMGQGDGQRGGKGPGNAPQDGNGQGNPPSGDNNGSNNGQIVPQATQSAATNS